MQEDVLQSARNLFIRRWGEMGASWGISRTMAELHALLYLADEPLCADDVMAKLEISRGNASMNLRQLVNWGLISRVHRRGDRKEYFQAETDVWQMFETIIRERRRREVEPIVEAIRRCEAMIDESRAGLPASALPAAEVVSTRFRSILEFCTLANTLFNMLSDAGRAGVTALTNAIPVPGSGVTAPTERERPAGANGAGGKKRGKGRP